MQVCIWHGSIFEKRQATLQKVFVICTATLEYKDEHSLVAVCLWAAQYSVKGQALMLQCCCNATYQVTHCGFRLKKEI